MNLTYECEICLNVNHAAKLHCQTCGTVPKQYSILKQPTRIVEGDYFTTFVPVVIAHGADRAEWHRTVRTYLRTVKADYYATE